MNERSIAVIGGGASGLIASIFSARAGNKVALYEKQKQCGRKLSITGNGQCNITNRNIDHTRYHGANPRFVQNVFGRFGLTETIQFFDSIGIPFVEKKQGKLYPMSLSAQLVSQILEFEAVRAGVTIFNNSRADEIIKKRSKLMIRTAGHEESMFDSVIIAAGSCAYPQLGSSPQGYELAKALGHTVIEPFPSILPINIPLKILHRLEGIKWDCALKVLSEGKVRAESTGEVLFTKYGISGPASLDISRSVHEQILANRNVSILVNFFPELNTEETAKLAARLLNDGDKPGGLALSGILKKRIPDILIEIAGCDPFAPCSSYDEKARRRIYSALSSLSLEPGPIRPFSEAVTAAGGIPVSEIDQKTMESKKVKGLYLCGEIIDIDGDTGGFNLQFAWSTGAIAGINA